MRRLLAGLAAPLLAVSLLSGCGGADEPAADDAPSTDPSSSAPDEEPSEDAPPTEEPSQDVTADAAGADTKYCELLGTDFATLFANISGPEDVVKAIGIIKQIAGEAPPKVEDEWGRMQGALGQVEGALTKAAKLQKQAADGKVTAKQLQKQTVKLTKDMEALSTPANDRAGDVVAKHASDYCGVTLG